MSVERAERSHTAVNKSAIFWRSLLPERGPTMPLAVNA